MAKYVATGHGAGSPRERWYCSHTGCEDPVFEPQSHFHLCAKHLIDVLKLAGVDTRGSRRRVTLDVAVANMARAVAHGTKPQGEVYYARLTGGRVKIGFSTNVSARMRSLRTTDPGLELLATEDGTADLERRRHAQFDHLRIDPNHEVFTLGADLSAWIDVIRLSRVA